MLKFSSIATINRREQVLSHARGTNSVLPANAVQP